MYTIQPDGTLANKQRYGWLHVPDTQENAWSDGLKCDTAGRVYTTSRMGIQVLDQAIREAERSRDEGSLGRLIAERRDLASKLHMRSSHSAIH